MDDTDNEVFKAFGNKLRMRVSGICMEEEKVLLVNHRGVNASNEFWAPPGGGLEFGQSAAENLKREFLEETGLLIEIEKFLCVNEYIGPPLHSIEIFFLVRRIGGKLMKGSEPELARTFEIIKNVEFKDWHWVKKQKEEHLHNLLNVAQNLSDLLNVSGYFLQLKNK